MGCCSITPKSENVEKFSLPTLILYLFPQIIPKKSILCTNATWVLIIILEHTYTCTYGPVTVLGTVCHNLRSDIPEWDVSVWRDSSHKFHNASQKYVTKSTNASLASSFKHIAWRRVTRRVTQWYMCYTRHVLWRLRLSVFSLLSHVLISPWPK